MAAPYLRRRRASRAGGRLRQGTIGVCSAWSASWWAGSSGWGAAQGGARVAARLAGGPAGADPGHLGHALAGRRLAADLGGRAGGARSPWPPGMWIMLGATLATRGRRSAGEGSLEAWAVSPNSGFWVVPAATAFAGSTGAMIAVLANVITTAWSAVAVHLMRRDAPFRQRRATSWVDQSPLLASLRGAPPPRRRPRPVLDGRRAAPGRPPAGLLGRGPVHGIGHPSAQPGGAASRCTPSAAGPG